MSGLFLTTAETAWIGVAGGAGLTGLSSWIMLRANRHRDHRQWIRDRTADLYEHVLVEIRDWSDTRVRLMRNYRIEGEDPEARGIPALDEEQRQRVLIRLQMIGDSTVQTAFEECASAHLQWIRFEEARRAAQQHNHQIAGGHTGEPRPMAEIERLSDERAAANQAASEKDEELLRAIQRALQRLP